MDDRDIVAACLAEGPEGFRPVVERYTGFLMATAMTVLGNREDAEDACQEAFVQAYRHLARFDPRRSFRTWISTILYRRCLNLLRRRAGMRGFIRRMGEAGLEAGPGDRPEPSPIRPLSPEFYRTLSPRERAALALWADRDFTPAEIAGALGCSEATARVTLFNARRKIRRLLDGDRS